MASRLPNPRRAKIHRSYTVDEVATLYGVHRNTVRQWIKQGLPTSDNRRPALILGHELAAFLTRKRTVNKRPCQPGEMYCLRCRTPRVPALGMADYHPLTTASGNLIGICPVCEGLMFRRTAFAKLASAKGNLEITFTQAVRHIDESGTPSVNSDFKAGSGPCANITRPMSASSASISST